jgi:hypothetical protein
LIGGAAIRFASEQQQCTQDKDASPNHNSLQARQPLYQDARVFVKKKPEPTCESRGNFEVTH